jgi:hypothetical protein
VVLDDNYNGYYYYDHRPQSRFKLVKTRMSENGYGDIKLTLQEYAPDTQKNTGEFVGTINYGRDSGVALIIFDGTFRNKSNGKTLPFEVIHAYRYR